MARKPTSAPPPAEPRFDPSSTYRVVFARTVTVAGLAIRPRCLAFVAGEALEAIPAEAITLADRV